MLILTSKDDSICSLYDSVRKNTLAIPVDEVKKLKQSGVEILGVTDSLRFQDNKSYINKLNILSDDYEYELTEDNLIWLVDTPDTDNIVINNRVNIVDTINPNRNLKELKVSGGSGLISTREMFLCCSKLVSIDISGLDTSNVIDMGGMFMQCERLISIDLSSLNTSNVRDMSEMFYFCHSLIDINLDGFDTSHVTDMRSMFSFCNSLTSFDISKLDLSSVRVVKDLFCNCWSLSEIDFTYFDKFNLYPLDYMFIGCNNLDVPDRYRFGGV